MKLFTFLLLFTPQLLSGQKLLSCNQKLNEFARWETSDATIRITDHHVTIQEVDGIVLAIEYTQIHSTELFDNYQYNGSVVATFPAKFLDTPALVSILSDHFKCILQ